MAKGWKIGTRKATNHKNKHHSPPPKSTIILLDNKYNQDSFPSFFFLTLSESFFFFCFLDNSLCSFIFHQLVNHCEKLFANAGGTQYEFSMRSFWSKLTQLLFFTLSLSFFLFIQFSCFFPRPALCSRQSTRNRKLVWRTKRNK